MAGRFTPKKKTIQSEMDTCHTEGQYDGDLVFDLNFDIGKKSYGLRHS